jgi:hypothetical protein
VWGKIYVGKLAFKLSPFAVQFSFLDSTGSEEIGYGYTENRGENLESA